MSDNEYRYTDPSELDKLIKAWLAYDHSLDYIWIEPMQLDQLRGERNNPRYWPKQTPPDDTPAEGA